MNWKVEFSRNALKDTKKLQSANLSENVKSLIDLLGNKRETESLHSKDFTISYPLSSIQIEVP